VTPWPQRRTATDHCTKTAKYQKGDII